jgi:hypothetical protein
MEEKHIAICGLNCSSCAVFIATKNNDDKLREKTAKEWTQRYVASNRNRPPLKPEEINCRGCLSAGPVYFHCLKCEIRKCGFGREIKNCKGCKEYKCAKLIELQSHLFKGVTDS